MKAITAKGITFQYKAKDNPLLVDVSFELAKGRIAAITGPSGSGKTTLGYCLSGVMPEKLRSKGG